MDVAAAPFTVDGLPLHPLLVHLVVVLLPLAALGAVVIALVPRWRRRYWLPVLVLAVLGIAAVPITQQAGEALLASLGPLNNPDLTRHSELGDGLLPYALAFGVALVALLVAGRLADRERTAAVRVGQPAQRQQPVAAGVYSLDEEPGPAGGPEDAPADHREPTPAGVSRFWRVITVLVSVAVVATAAAVGYEVYKVGDSGASAVWKGVGGSR
ncbi:DUF2231 domain-containing protein [Kutzneria albida]|uniref:Putative membrane protein n=1 Tax=Kutzneria albida DSM 43870 TaxID=1449976 RepID=W5W1J2_9PSEU|nr:DUF2231 domain-containing protein [Kutzneria albida]AHH94630.1 putative membrane protein [Kutzneria albida DSM 43870]